MLQGLDKGRAPPAWFLNYPEELPGDDVWLGAFWNLTTERQVGMATGPIPYSKTTEYATALGLGGGMLRIFHALIRAMDSAYLGWIQKQQDARTPIRPSKSRRP